MTDDPTGGHRGPPTPGAVPDPELDETLSAYLDEELEPAAVRDIEAALAASPALRERLARLREADARLRALPAPALPADLAARMRARIATEGVEAPGRAGRAATPRRRRWLAPALAAAAAAILALLVVPRLRTPAPDETTPQLTRRQPPEATPAPVVPEQAEPTAEEIVVALALENDTDLEVIEVLDWLEALGEIEGEERS